MNAAGKIFRKLSFVLRPLYRFYARFSHTYSFRGLRIVVEKDTFNPVLFHSSIDMIDHVESNGYAPGKLLELGCGSAMMGIYFARQGWTVTCSDISHSALENAHLNARNNKVNVEFVQGDLFENLEDSSFDLILINPPFFPSDPENDGQRAWYCGSSFEYYTKLFSQLNERRRDGEEVLMVLSDQANITEILKKAEYEGLSMSRLMVKPHFYEDIFIYRIG